MQKIWVKDSSYIVGIKFSRCGNHFFHIDWATGLIKHDGIQCPVCRTKYNQATNESYKVETEKLIL